MKAQKKIAQRKVTAHTLRVEQWKCEKYDKNEVRTTTTKNQNKWNV